MMQNFNKHPQGPNSYSHSVDFLLDQPIYSRLFIKYDKNLTQYNLRDAFSKFGLIEDLKIPFDSQGTPKNICFIKFSKTSEAAYALESMHLKTLPGSQRVLKVSVANNRSEVDNNEYDDEKYRRLFIHVPKNMGEQELEKDFTSFGHIISLTIQRDRNSGESKGLAYVTFAKFSEAANAYEKCERQYRAIFAKPKSIKSDSISNVDLLAQPPSIEPYITSMIGNRLGGFTKVNFMCALQVSANQIERLFDLIPGMTDFSIQPDFNNNCARGTVTYSNPNSAVYALEKLHEFPYPPGLLLLVKPDQSSFLNRNFRGQQGYVRKNMPEVVSKLKNAIFSSTSSGTPDLAQLSEAIMEANKILKIATGVPDGTDLDTSNVNYCSVKLPPTKPLADIDSTLAKRCFLVCKPAPPPLTVLRDIFCRFGDLINVYTLPNKTVGYARYASESAADQAIKTLHGAEICGVRMRVLEADDEAPPKRRRYNDETD